VLQKGVTVKLLIANGHFTPQELATKVINHYSPKEEVETKSMVRLYEESLEKGSGFEDLTIHV